MRRLWIVLSLMAAATLGLGFSGDNEPVRGEKPPERERTSSPADAVSLADANLSIALQEKRIPFPYTIRYLWVQNGGQEEYQVGSLWLHMISANSLFKQPVRAAQGFLIRVDLRHYANDDPKTLQRLIDTWEELRFDPAFYNHQLDKDGEIVVTTLSKAVDHIVWGRLADKLQTVVPIVSLDYFLVRASTAIQDQGGSEKIYGGLYYRFTGLGDEEEVLRFLGVGDGGDVAKFYDRLPSLRRVAVRKSSVTGKKRGVKIFPTEATDSGAWGAVTEDGEDGKDGGRNSPLHALLTFKVAAKEGIFVNPLGLHWFVLWNGEGKRQDVAPQQVVTADQYFDRQGHRNPHSTRLQPAISCIACHWSTGQDGWLPLRNDIYDAMKRGTFPYAELGFDDVFQRDRLERLYQGPSLKLVIRAKADLSEAVLRATGPWESSETQADVVKLSSRKLLKMVQEYLYEPIDARQALREIGIVPPKDNIQAAALLSAIVPPARIGEVEELDIDDLRAGKSINRFDWDIIRGRVGASIKR